jgi:hypothetical protein
MWSTGVRVFVVTSLLLNGTMAIALVASMATGARTVTGFDALIATALLLGFLNAIGDLIEAERPLASEDADAIGQYNGAAGNVARRHRDTDTTPEGPDDVIALSEALEMFPPERDVRTTGPDPV